MNLKTKRGKMYKNLKDILEFAEEKNITVGSFNMHNLEMLPSMVRAAQKEGSPIIIQTSASTARYIGMDIIVSVCKELANEEGIDLALHLDHATNFEDIKDAISAGYSSVMYDGSKLSFKENILKTCQVVEYAKARNVSVEGELGTISGAEDDHYYSENNYTDPKMAKEFVKQTNVDALAVSVGTQHGSYKAKTELNLELLKEINEQAGCPLVIHGGTGVAEKDIAKCTEYGVRKFNVGTELLVGWSREAKQQFSNNPVDSSLRNSIVPCNETVAKVVTRKTRLFLGYDCD